MTESTDASLVARHVPLVSTPAGVWLTTHGDRLPRGLRGLTMLAGAVIRLRLSDLMGRGAWKAFMMMSIITVRFLVVIGALWTLRRLRVA